jgi:hypothetical protein
VHQAKLLHSDPGKCLQLHCLVHEVAGKTPKDIQVLRRDKSTFMFLTWWRTFCSTAPFSLFSLQACLCDSGAVLIQSS